MRATTCAMPDDHPQRTSDPGGPGIGTTFALGAALPLLLAVLIRATSGVRGRRRFLLPSLALLGGLAARPAVPGVGRCLAGNPLGALAMAATAAVGALFGTVA